MAMRAFTLGAGFMLELGTHKILGSPHDFTSDQRRHTYASRLEYWTCTVENDPPRIEYQAVMDSDEGVREWTSLIVSCAKGGPIHGADRVEAEMGLLFCRWMSCHGEGNSRAPRTNSVHPSYALR